MRRGQRQNHGRYESVENRAVTCRCVQPDQRDVRNERERQVPLPALIDAFKEIIHHCDNDEERADLETALGKPR